MANKYAGTQTEKNLLEAFQESHRQEISILISHQRLKRTDSSRFLHYS